LKRLKRSKGGAQTEESGSNDESGQNRENSNIPTKKLKTHTFSDGFKDELKNIEDFVRSKRGVEISEEDMFTIVEDLSDRVMHLYRTEFLDPIGNDLANGTPGVTDAEFIKSKDDLQFQVQMRMQMLLHLLTSD